MDRLPPFVSKYVSKQYYENLDWNEKTAYLKGIQDVMNLFNKELEEKAMQVLQRKAHWLEPRTNGGPGSVPIEFTSARTAATISAATAAVTAAATTATAATAAVNAKATTQNGAKVAAPLPKTWQSSQAGSQSSQSSSQPLKGGSQPSSQQQQQQQASQSSHLARTTSQPHLKRKTIEPAPLDMEITFVGMRYRGGHVFSSSDKVRLERDHKNPVDKNAIKAMVLKKGVWVHAAYVGRDDASALKDQLGIEHMKLTYLRAYVASVKFRLQA